MKQINNEDCFKTIGNIAKGRNKVSLILTSPPYNTCRNSTDSKRRDNYEARYDIHLDNMTDSEYLDWTTRLFKGFDSILKENGVVYDPFLGTGSTGLACETLGIKWLGSEISKAQCEYAKDRIKEFKNDQ